MLNQSCMGELRQSFNVSCLPVAISLLSRGLHQFNLQILSYWYLFTTVWKNTLRSIIWPSLALFSWKANKSSQVEWCDRAGACDQSKVQSDWWTKFCYPFWWVADKQGHIFAAKQNCTMKNWTKTVVSDLNQVKKQKQELCCVVKRKEIFVQICRR